MPFITVDESDFRFAARGGHEPGIEGEHAGFGVEFGDVHHVRAFFAFVNRKADILAIY
jgi:hypothetical protein